MAPATSAGAMIWKMRSDVNVSCRRCLRLRRSRIVNWLHQLVPNPLHLSAGGGTCGSPAAPFCACGSPATMEAFTLGASTLL